MFFIKNKNKKIYKLKIINEKNKSLFSFCMGEFFLTSLRPFTEKESVFFLKNLKCNKLVIEQENVLLNYTRKKTMIVGRDQTTLRAENQKKRQREIANEDEKEVRCILQALGQVRIDHHVEQLANLSLQVYAREVAQQLSLLKCSQLDTYTVTVSHWIAAIDECYKKFPIPKSTVRPISFINGDNNINKFFGNYFGNILRKFAINMAKFYIGNSFKYHHNYYEVLIIN
jgi:hypothetical protein